MVRSGSCCRTLCTMKFFWTNFFWRFLYQKTVPPTCHRHFGNTLPIMAPKSALAPRLSRSIRVPQPPYSSMWCPYVTPKRRERPLAAYWSVGNRIVFVMRGFEEKSIEKSWCHPSSIMAMERPNGAPGAHPRGQYRFLGAQIRVWGTLVCI